MNMMNDSEWSSKCRQKHTKTFSNHELIAPSKPRGNHQAVAPHSRRDSNDLMPQKCAKNVLGFPAMPMDPVLARRCPRLWKYSSCVFSAKSACDWSWWNRCKYDFGRASLFCGMPNPLAVGPTRSCAVFQKHLLWNFGVLKAFKVSVLFSICILSLSVSSCSCSNASVAAPWPASAASWSNSMATSSSYPPGSETKKLESESSNHVFGTKFSANSRLYKAWSKRPVSRLSPRK